MPLKTRRRSVLEHAIIHSQDELDRLIKELDAQEQHELEENQEECLESQLLYYLQKLFRIFKRKIET